MTGSGVSTLVCDILLVFADNMNMLLRPRKKRQKKNSRPSRMSQDELKLHDSLENRPKEIKAEYAQNVVKHGKRFEQGDQKAYSDLAQTLLILNTGLINLINHALTADKTDMSRSRQSLLLLSESAATSTKRALSQLDARLTYPFVNDIRSNPQSQHRSQAEKEQTNIAPAIRPGPSPLLERGGWVRSKSGSSVVSAASARRLATQGTKHQKRRTPPHQSNVVTVHKSATNVPESQVKVETQDLPCSCQSSPKLSESKWNVETVEKEGLSRLERNASMIMVSADYFDTYDTFDDRVSAPPRPPKIPLHSRANPRIHARPISAATFLTASTKIGEIPEHKWPERLPPQQEQEYLPLPYVIPPPLQPLKKKSRGLRFWKKAMAE